MSDYHISIIMFHFGFLIEMDKALTVLISLHGCITLLWELSLQAIVKKQADSNESRGRKIPPTEQLELGDLLFILKEYRYIQDGK